MPEIVLQPQTSHPQAPRERAEPPAADEYAPYYERYISLVPAGDIVGTLDAQIADSLALLHGVGEARAGHRYAPDKWSIREVVGHMTDAERIFTYRALRFARDDRTPLPGFEENDYVRAAGFDTRPLAELADELALVRRATVALFAGMDGAALVRRGSANRAECSVRALAHICAGHELHHARIIRERYL
ncbi:MAG: DinB family protein [Gemmatimonadaceae bacterium]